MITSNYHTHTYFCDGSSEPEKYVIEAIRKGFTSLGFSAHAPLPLDTTWNLAQADLEPYCAEILKLKEKYRGLIDVYLSMEIDYIPGLSNEIDFYRKSCSLDYTIGAVHLVKNADNGEIWFIDGPVSNYDNGLKKIFKNDIRLAVDTYFAQLNEMIVNEKPDIIAHFDKVKMNNQGRYFKESDLWYKSLLAGTIENIKRSGSVVEVNTRGIYTGKCDSLYPGVEVLKKCFDAGIPVTISSDAHKPADICSYFDETEKILKDIGYNAISVIKNDQWAEQEINR